MAHSLAGLAEAHEELPSCHPKAWEGEASQRAAHELTRHTNHLGRHISAMRTVQKGVVAAASDVAKIEAALADLDAYAGANNVAVSGDGTVRDVSPSVTMPVSQIAQYEAGRQAVVDRAASMVGDVLTQADAADAALSKAARGVLGDFDGNGHNGAAAGPRGSQNDSEIILTDFQNPANEFGTQPGSGLVGDPVHAGSGNFTENEPDLDFFGPLRGLAWARTYNSRSLAVAGGGFGARWRSWAEVLLLGREDGSVSLTGPDGRVSLIPRSSDGGFGRAMNMSVTVSASPQDEFILTFLDGQVWEFDWWGQIAATEAGPGTRVQFVYKMVSGARRLVAMRHVASDTAVQVCWEADRIVGLECTDGRRIDYAYDDSIRLVEAAGGPHGRRHYAYDQVGFLARVTDADGVCEVSNTYDERGRVVSQIQPSGQVTDLEYLPGLVTAVSQRGTDVKTVWTSDEFGRCTSIVDAYGAEHRVEYDTVGNAVRFTDRAGEVTQQWFDQRSRLVGRRTADGARTDLEWDSKDRLVRVTTPETDVGRPIWVLTYKDNSRIPATVIDPLGGVTRAEVDDSGQVTSVTDPDGVVTTLEWDRSGRLAAAVDGMGARTTFEYDSVGHLLARTSPSGIRWAFAYDRAGRLSAVKGPDGATWRVEHSAAGRVVAVTDPTGARTESRFDERGLTDAVVHPDDSVTSYDWDSFGNLRQIVDPDGALWGFQHDPMQRLVASVDPMGQQWTTTYDVVGNVISEADPTGCGTEYGLDVMGRPTMIDDGVDTTRITYDLAGRVTTRVGADGGVTQLTHDACGRVVAVSDAAGGVTRYARSAAGRVTSMTTPGGRVESYTYDAAGRVSAITEPGGKTSQVTYSPDGLVSARIWPDGSSDTFDHDPWGRVVAAHRAGHGTTRYSYDPVGRVVGISDAGFGDRRFVYDNVGNLIETVDGNGAVTRYTYDAAGRVIKRVDPLGGTTTWTYDAAGRPIPETDPLGRILRSAYDAAGRLVQQQDTDGSIRDYSYDAAGELTGLKVTSPGPTGAPEVHEYVVTEDAARRSQTWTGPQDTVTLTFDPLGRLIGRVREDQSGRQTALGWSYDADGYRTAFTHHDGTITEYTLDAAGEVVGLTHPQVGAATLQRDPSGRVVEMTAPNLQAFWEHGPAGPVRHTVIRNGKTTVTEVSRDAAGRPVRLVSVTPAGNREVTEYQYDAAGQLLSAVTPNGTWRYTYDQNGRLVREMRSAGDSLAGTRTYSYDAAGQLLHVTEPVATGGVSRREYEYNALGQRVTETMPGGLVRSFAYDVRGYLMDTTVTDDVGEIVTHRAMTVDALGELARVDDTLVCFDSADPLNGVASYGARHVLVGGPVTASGSRDGSAEWLAPDWRGMPSTVGDPFNPLPRQRDGSEFGNLGDGTHLDGLGELQIDGLTWLRNRVYDPNTRSFTEPDPLPGVPGTGWAANTYSYAGNNPTTLSDPWGLSPTKDGDVQSKSQNTQGMRDVFGWLWGGAKSLGKVIANDVLTLLEGYLHDPFSAIETGLGLLLMVLGGDSELGGVALDVTGLGVFAGVPINAFGAGLIASGLAMMADGTGRALNSGKDSNPGSTGDARAGSAGTAPSAPSSKGLIKKAQLPTTGKIRFVPPKGWKPHSPLPREKMGKKSGYIDRFDNVWQEGPSRTAGEPFEWDVQLSKEQSKYWSKKFGKTVRHLNVSMDGKITHVSNEG